MITEKKSGFVAKRFGFVAKMLKNFGGDIEPKMWLIKFTPLLVMQMASIFAYTIVKNAKTAVLLRVADTTIINYMKIFIIIPMSFMFPFLLNFIIKRLKGRKEQAPYIILGIFTIFFLVFMYCLLPYGSIVHFPWLINVLSSIPYFPQEIAHGLGGLLSYWDYSLFYGVSEMVAVVFINMFSWGAANEVCSSGESKIFYSIFGGLTAFASYAAAGIMYKSKLSAVRPDQLTGVVQGILLKVLLALAVFGLAYLFIERYVMKKEAYMPKKEAKSKPKIDQGAGYAMVARSPYLLKIGLMVVSYSLLIVMFEQCLYEAIQTSNRAVLSSITAKTSQVNSIVTLAMSFLGIWFSGLPWVVRAMLPVVMMGGGGLVSVFLFLTQGSSVASAGTAAVIAGSVAPLVVPVVFGCVSNVMARSTKYTFFDSTKEQLFRVSNDPDVRSKGKAVIDVVFGRVGKGGSSIIVLTLLLLQPVGSHIFKRNSKGQEHSLAASEARSVVNVNMAGDTLSVTVDLDKATKSGWVANENQGLVTLTKPLSATSAPAPTKSKAKIKDIAPALLVICALIVGLWAYAVLSIAPMYGENIKSEGVSENTSIDLNNFIKIFGIAGVMFVIIFLILNRELSPILLGAS